VNLDAFLHIVVRRGWLALALAALLGAAAYAYASSRTPIYEAESRIAIQAARPAEFGQTQAINGLLRSFTADVVTTELAQEVADTVGGVDAATLKANASAAADEGTREVRIRYHSTDPATAERVADVWSTVFVARRAQANLQLDQTDRIFATKRDATSHSLWWPRKKMLTALGLAAGFALGALLALLWEFDAAARVRAAADLKDLGVGACLGSVPVAVGERRDRRGGPARPAIRRVVRLGWPVALGAACGCTVALALSATRPPEYRARTRIAIEPARTSDWGQSMAIREILRGYGEDISTRRMAEEVARRLQLDLPAERLLGTLSVAPNEETYEIWVDVLHGAPAIAEGISRTWADAFAEERIIANQELDARDRIYARIRDATPAELYAPKPATNALAGAVMGALVGAAVALALGSARPQTHAPDGLATDYRILGMIPGPDGGAATP
jgi:capsular polysaccharide biosynthesis protein